jgi:hypothetical protein
MMVSRRSVRVSMSSLLVALACLGMAPEAAAQRGILGWLDKLSGPGPFTLVGAEIEVACYGVRRLATRDTPTDAAAQVQASGGPDMSSLWVLDPGCYRADRRRPRASLVAQFAGFFNGDNPLLYGEGSVRERSGSDVGGFLFIPAIDVSLNRFVDVGAGLGLVRFSGDDFNAFTRGAIQPFRVTLRPLAGIGDGGAAPGNEWLQVRATGLLIGRLEAADFGAIPGTYTESGEFQWQVQLLIDLGSLGLGR